MPLRPNLIEDLLGILNYTPRSTPTARAPLRPVPAPSDAGFIDELARRLGTRAPSSSTPPSPASSAGETAVRGALFGPQGTPPRPAPSPPAPAAEGALGDLRTELQNLLGGTSSTATPPRTRVQAAASAPPPLPPLPTPQTAAAGAQQFLRDHLGYVPAGEPVAWARSYGLTSPETYRAGTAQRHPTLYRSDLAGQASPVSPQAVAATQYHLDTLQRAFSGANGGHDGSWLTTPQRRALARARVAGFDQPLRVQQALNEAGLPITQAQIDRRLNALGRPSQPITPSRANQPQTAGARTVQRADYTQPSVQEWFQRHGRGIDPAAFNTRYFGGLLNDPAVSATRDTMHLNGTLRAPQQGLTLQKRDGTVVQIPGGTYLGTIQRRINMGERSVYNAYFALNDRWQGLGIGKTLLRGQVELYRRLGINKVKVSAGLDGGGHTWARFGFVPDAAGWRSLADNTLIPRLNQMTGLDPAYKAAVLRMLQSNDPVMIRQVAKLSMTPGVNTDSRLGARLLRGSGWSGTLDLRDADTMRHFDDYVRDAPTLGGPAWGS